MIYNTFTWFLFVCVYYYDYLYVFYMLDIGRRAIESVFPVCRHANENKDYLSI